MPDRERLKALLARIDGRPYPAWRDLRGAWRLGAWTLHVDHVQGDPFAAPSRVRLVGPSGVAEGILRDADRRLAAEDWLLRAFGEGLRGTKRGSGKSGRIDVYRPGPEVVERSALRLHQDGSVEARFAVGLPARGRRVLGREGEALLLGDLSDAASRLRPGPGFEGHVRSVARQRALRRALRPAGLVAFVEDGAVLPRASGVSEAPLPDALPFESPPSLRVTLSTPEGDAVGMGLPEGVTVITGGGFHGKSTLLDAIGRGWLDHVPGDGREGVVSDPDTVRVRAEDGRRVCGVDISPFLGELPGGRDTRAFHTDDASGSTSQAAAIVEAAEAGARTLLIDEDTSATNLMVRDARMRALIPRDREPITPFVERVRQLYEDWGLSTVLVVGGVGDVLGAADRVIGMDAWRARDVTEEARALGVSVPEPPDALAEVGRRVPLPEGLEARKVRARGRRAVTLDREELDLTGVAGIRDAEAARTLGLAVDWLARAGVVDGRRDWRAVLDAFDAILDDEGVEALSPWEAPPGDLVRPRRHELAAALSRWRSLRVR